MEKKQDYATWILIALLFILKLKIFIKTLLMMLMKSLININIMEKMKGHFQLVKINK